MWSPQMLKIVFVSIPIETEVTNDSVTVTWDASRTTKTKARILAVKCTLTFVSLSTRIRKVYELSSKHARKGSFTTPIGFDRYSIHMNAFVHYAGTVSEESLVAVMASTPPPKQAVANIVFIGRYEIVLSRVGEDFAQGYLLQGDDFPPGCDRMLSGRAFPRIPDLEDKGIHEVREFEQKQLLKILHRVRTMTLEEHRINQSSVKLLEIAVFPGRAKPEDKPLRVVSVEPNSYLAFGVSPLDPSAPYTLRGRVVLSKDGREWRTNWSRKVHFYTQSQLNVQKYFSGTSFVLINWYRLYRVEEEWVSDVPRTSGTTAGYPEDDLSSSHTTQREWEVTTKLSPPQSSKLPFPVNTGAKWSPHDDKDGMYEIQHVHGRDPNPYFKRLYAILYNYELTIDSQGVKEQRQDKAACEICHKLITGLVSSFSRHTIKIRQGSVNRSFGAWSKLYVQTLLDFRVTVHLIAENAVIFTVAGSQELVEICSETPSNFYTEWNRSAFKRSDAETLTAKSQNATHYIMQVVKVDGGQAICWRTFHPVTDRRSKCGFLASNTQYEILVNIIGPGRPLESWVSLASLVTLQPREFSVSHVSDHSIVVTWRDTEASVVIKPLIGMTVVSDQTLVTTWWFHRPKCGARGADIRIRKTDLQELKIPGAPKNSGPALANRKGDSSASDTFSVSLSPTVERKVIAGFFADTAYDVYTSSNTGRRRDANGFSYTLTFTTLPSLQVKVDTLGACFVVVGVTRPPRSSHIDALLAQSGEKARELTALKVKIGRYSGQEEAKERIKQLQHEAEVFNVVGGTTADFDLDLRIFETDKHDFESEMPNGLTSITRVSDQGSASATTLYLVEHLAPGISYTASCRCYNTWLSPEMAKDDRTGGTLERQKNYLRDSRSFCSWAALSHFETLKNVKCSIIAVGEYFVDILLARPALPEHLERVKTNNEVQLKVNGALAPITEVPPSQSFSIRMNGLHADLTYLVHARDMMMKESHGNGVVWGPWSLGVEVRTLPVRPSLPVIYELNQTHISFWWTKCAETYKFDDISHVGRTHIKREKEEVQEQYCYSNCPLDQVWGIVSGVAKSPSYDTSLPRVVQRMAEAGEFTSATNPEKNAENNAPNDAPPDQPQEGEELAVGIPDSVEPPKEEPASDLNGLDLIWRGGLKKVVETIRQQRDDVEEAEEEDPEEDDDEDPALRFNPDGIVGGFAIEGLVGCEKNEVKGKKQKGKFRAFGEDGDQKHKKKSKGAKGKGKIKNENKFDGKRRKLLNWLQKNQKIDPKTTTRRLEVMKRKRQAFHSPLLHGLTAKRKRQVLKGLFPSRRVKIKRKKFKRRHNKEPEEEDEEEEEEEEGSVLSEVSSADCLAPCTSPVSNNSDDSNPLGNDDDSVRNGMRSGVDFMASLRRSAHLVNVVWEGGAYEETELPDDNTLTFMVNTPLLSEMYQILATPYNDDFDREHLHHSIQANERDSLPDQYETIVQCAGLPSVSKRRPILSWLSLGRVTGEFVRMALPQDIPPASLAFRIQTSSLAAHRYYERHAAPISFAPRGSQRSPIISWKRLHPPQTPSMLKVMYVTHKTAMVSWVESASLRTHNQVRYIVMLKRSDEPWEDVLVVRGTIASVESLQKNTPYRLAVRTESTFGVGRPCPPLLFCTAVTSIETPAAVKMFQSKEVYAENYNTVVSQQYPNRADAASSEAMQKYAFDQPVSEFSSVAPGLDLQQFKDQYDSSQFVSLASLRPGLIPEPDVVEPAKWRWPYPCSLSRDTVPPPFPTPFHLADDLPQLRKLGRGCRTPFLVIPSVPIPISCPEHTQNSLDLGSPPEEPGVECAEEDVTKVPSNLKSCIKRAYIPLDPIEYSDDSDTIFRDDIDSDEVDQRLREVEERRKKVQKNDYDKERAMYLETHQYHDSFAHETESAGKPLGDDSISFANIAANLQAAQDTPLRTNRRKSVTFNYDEDAALHPSDITAKDAPLPQREEEVDGGEDEPQPHNDPTPLQRTSVCSSGNDLASLRGYRSASSTPGLTPSPQLDATPATIADMLYEEAEGLEGDTDFILNPQPRRNERHTQIAAMRRALKDVLDTTPDVDPSDDASINPDPTSPTIRGLPRKDSVLRKGAPRIPRPISAQPPRTAMSMPLHIPRRPSSAGGRRLTADTHDFGLNLNFASDEFTRHIAQPRKRRSVRNRVPTPALRTKEKAEMLPSLPVQNQAASLAAAVPDSWECESEAETIPSEPQFDLNPTFCAFHKGSFSHADALIANHPILHQWQQPNAQIPPEWDADSNASNDSQRFAVQYSETSIQSD